MLDSINRASIDLGIFFETGFKLGFLDNLPQEKLKEVDYGTIIGKSEKEIINSQIYQNEATSYPKDFFKIIRLGKKSFNSIIESLELNLNPDFIGRVFLPESEERSWYNADLLFVQDKTLYVFELTMLGGKRIHDAFVSPKTVEEINLSPYGLNVDVGSETGDLISVAEQILSFLNEEKFLIFSVTEYEKVVQALEYVFRFLGETDKEIERVFVATVYPFFEGIKSFFSISPNTSKEKFIELADKIASLRDSFKKKVSKSLSLIYADELEERLKKERTEKIKIRPKKTIKEIRNEVRKIVFSTKEKGTGNIIALCQPAGAGKTTSLIEYSFSRINEGKKVLFLYFTPRRKIIQDKQLEIEFAIKKNKYRGVELLGDKKFLITSSVKVEEKKKNRKSKTKKSSGFSYTKEEGKGILKTIKDEIVSLTYPHVEASEQLSTYDGIYVLATMQTLTQVEGIGYNPSTINNLKQIIETFKSSFHNDDKEILLVIDEILADSSGLTRLREILTFFSEYKDLMNIFVLDANLSNGYIFQQILNKAEYYKAQKILYIPPAVYKVKGEELLKREYSFKYHGWDFLAYGSPGFIGKSLNLHFDIQIFKEEDEIVKTIVETLRKEKEKVFLYIQDKSLGLEIQRALSDERKVYMFNATYSDTEDTKEIKNADVVIGTSSISRGIDVPFRKVYAFIYEFNVEQQVAELYQAISRNRGIKNKKGENVDHLIERDVHVLLYRTVNQNLLDQIEDRIEDFGYSLFTKESLITIYKYLKHHQLIGLKNLIISMIEGYVNPDKNKEYLFPVPEIRPALYNPNVSPFDGFISLLNDLEFIKRYNQDYSKFNISYKVVSFYKERSKPVFSSYPFEIYKSPQVNLQIPLESLKKLKRYIEKIPEKMLKNKYKHLETLSKLIEKAENNMSLVTLQGVYVVRYVPAKVYDVSPNKKFKIKNKRITRNGYTIAGNFPIVSVSDNGKLFITILDFSPTSTTFTPKLPIEIFFR